MPDSDGAALNTTLLDDPRGATDQVYQTDCVWSEQVTSPRAAASKRPRDACSAGAKERQADRRLHQKLDLNRLDLAIDWGWFFWHHQADASGRSAWLSIA